MKHNFVFIETKNKIWNIPHKMFHTICDLSPFFSSYVSFNNYNYDKINLAYINDTDFFNFIIYVKYFMSNKNNIDILSNKYKKFNNPAYFNELLSFIIFLNYINCNNKDIKNLLSNKYFQNISSFL
jgi:hypothetical protein